MKIKILFPIIWDNMYSDSLYTIVKTIVANRGLDSVPIVKQVLRGMSLNKKPNGWDLLATLKTDNYFSTKRTYFMDLIGLLVGYYLRSKASHLCQRLNCKLKPIERFEDMHKLFSTCEKAIRPVIIELNVVQRTADRFKGFVELCDDLFAMIKSEQSISCTKNTTIYQIKPEYEQLAWNCLNCGDTSAFFPSRLTNESLPSSSSLDFNSTSLEDASQAFSPGMDMLSISFSTSEYLSEIETSAMNEESSDGVIPDFSDSNITITESLNLLQYTGVRSSTSNSNLLKSDLGPPTHSLPMQTRQKKRRNYPTRKTVMKPKRYLLKKLKSRTKTRRRRRLTWSEADKILIRESLKNLKFAWIKFTPHANYVPGFIHPTEEDGKNRAQWVTQNGVVSDRKCVFTSFSDNLLETLKTQEYVTGLLKFNNEFRMHCD